MGQDKVVQGLTGAARKLQVVQMLQQILQEERCKAKRSQNKEVNQSRMVKMPMRAPPNRQQLAEAAKVRRPTPAIQTARIHRP